jgi:hypothetical protein
MDGTLRYTNQALARGRRLKTYNPSHIFGHCGNAVCSTCSQIYAASLFDDDDDDDKDFDDFVDNKSMGPCNRIHVGKSANTNTKVRIPNRSK